MRNFAGCCHPASSRFCLLSENKGKAVLYLSLEHIYHRCFHLLRVPVTMSHHGTAVQMVMLSTKMGPIDLCSPSGTSLSTGFISFRFEKITAMVFFDLFIKGLRYLIQFAAYLRVLAAPHEFFHVVITPICLIGL